MKIKVDSDLRRICQQITDENHTLEEWAGHESDDQFQAGPFTGGFNSLESAFCFSYRENPDTEYWVQISLDEVPRILSDELTEVEAEPIVDL